MTRSENMSRIRRKDTTIEISLRKELWHSGVRYRLGSHLFGKPDLTFPQAYVAVFVDGCFWHGCPLHGGTPKSNVQFWTRKLERNKVRDIGVTETLEQMGWLVLRYWEHDIRLKMPAVVNDIRHAVGNRRHKRGSLGRCS